MTKNINRKQERTVKASIFIIVGTVFFLLFLLAYYFENQKDMIIILLITGCFIIISRYWMIRDSKGIPILMFHSVTNDSSWMPWPYLCVSVKDFTGMLGLLKKKGYRTVSLTEVKNHMSGTSLLSGKVVCLTFDDGYLDNWVTASPMMRKFGFSGTLFMATDFIDPSITIRPSLDDAKAGHADQEALYVRGYLSLAELQAMEKEGIFSIESHTASHTSLYNGETLKGFLGPGDPRLVWHYWNFFPEKKRRWYADFFQEQKCLWGYPVFEFSRAHMNKRAYFPNDKAGEMLNRYVMENGGDLFFKKDNPIKKLAAKFDELKRSNSGHWETRGETEDRIDRELWKSKKILETELGKKVRYLCWPGEIATEHLQSLATDTYHYSAMTGGAGCNAVGENAKLFSRIYVKHRYVPFKSHFLNKYLFYAEIKVFEGNYYFYIICLFFNQFNKLLKLVYRRQLSSIQTYEKN
jgi:hypothetical protein